MNESRSAEASEQPAARQQAPASTPAGQWPEPTSPWAVIAAGALWAAWVALLVWMMILRLDSTP